MNAHKEKAGGCNPPATTRPKRPYHARPRKSSPFRKILPGRPDRRPPQAPASTYPENSTQEALGWLMLYLLGRSLPQVEQSFGWRLAETWLRQIVDGQPVRCT